MEMAGRYEQGVTRLAARLEVELLGERYLGGVATWSFFFFFFVREELTAAAITDMVTTKRARNYTQNKSQLNQLHRMQRYKYNDDLMIQVESFLFHGILRLLIR